MASNSLYKFVSSNLTRSVDTDERYTKLCKLIGYMDNAICVFKQLHWNYEGASFEEIHELFGETYDLVGTFQDRIAERLRALNLPVFFSPIDLEVDYTVNYLTSATNVLISLGQQVFVHIDGFDDDLVTQNILIEFKEQLDKKVYFLSSYK